MPHERCGFTYEARGYPDLGRGCCWRPTWGGRDRCIWHADAERKPAGALEAAATSHDVRLDGAVLTGATLDDATWPAGTVLVGADVSRSSAESAHFSGADLRNATFDDTSLRGADFRSANLEDAFLRDADLKGTVFVRARLHEADFSRSYVGRDTRFGERIVYEDELDGADSLPAKRGAFDAATWTYRMLQYQCRENGLIERTEEFFYREKDLRRRFAWERSDYFHAIRAEGSRYLLGYGYRVRGILLASLFVILAAAAVYPFLGGVRESLPDGTVTYALSPSLDHSLSEAATAFAKSFYLSLESFTTLGIGDVTPAGYAAQVLAGLEALIGYTLVALLISVLARRRFWL